MCLEVHGAATGCHCGSQGVAGKGHFRASAAAAVEGPSHGVLGDIAYGPIRKVYAKSKPVCTSTSGWPGRRAVVLAGHLHGRQQEKRRVLDVIGEVARSAKPDHHAGMGPVQADLALWRARRRCGQKLDELHCGPRSSAPHARPTFQISLVAERHVGEVEHTVRLVHVGDGSCQAGSKQSQTPRADHCLSHCLTHEHHIEANIARRRSRPSTFLVERSAHASHFHDQTDSQLFRDPPHASISNVTNIKGQILPHA